MLEKLKLEFQNEKKRAIEIWPFLNPIWLIILLQKTSLYRIFVGWSHDQYIHEL